MDPRLREDDEAKGDARSEAGMTCKGIKREATCGLTFDSCSSHATKWNDKVKVIPERCPG